MKVGDLLRETTLRFRGARLHFGHGTATARDEASWLVGHVTGIHPGDVHLHQRDPVSVADLKRVRRLAERRVRDRIPLAYLLREAWLDGRTFHVDRRVIVPRSHIAFLLKDLRFVPKRILDLCTGSGCLAILAARAFPDARVDASDISRDALAVAARNVRTHGRRVRLIRSDLFENIEGRYDLILSNPPYVSTPSMRKLPAEYRHEPGLALGGGRDGLQFVSRILAGAAQHLTPKGMLMCEVGENRKALERACPSTRFNWPQDQVFTLARASMAGASRKPPTPARAR